MILNLLKNNDVIAMIQNLGEFAYTLKSNDNIRDNYYIY